MSIKINKRRKLTGNCDYMRLVDVTYKPLLAYCGKPARFYPPEEAGMFGIYACDDCLLAKYPEVNVLD